MPRPVNDDAPRDAQYEMAVCQVTEMGSVFFQSLGFHRDSGWVVEYTGDLRELSMQTESEGETERETKESRVEKEKPPRAATSSSNKEVLAESNAKGDGEAETRGGKKRIFLGVFWGVLGALGYTFFVLASKALAQREVSWTQAAASRGLFGVLLSFPMLPGRRVLMSREEAKNVPLRHANFWLVAYCFLAAVSLTSSIVAVQLIDAATASAIFSGGPFLAGIMGRVWFGDRFTWSDVVWTVVSVLGSVMAVLSEFISAKPRDTSVGERAAGVVLAVFVAFVAAALFAMARLYREGASPWLWTFWSNLFACIVAFVSVPVDVVMMGDVAPWGDEGVDWVSTVLLGVVGLSSLMALVSYALCSRYLPGGQASLLATMDLPLIAVGQVVWLGLMLDWYAVAGLVLILVAALAPPLTDLLKKQRARKGAEGKLAACDSDVSLEEGGTPRTRRNDETGGPGSPGLERNFSSSSSCSSSSSVC
uniref:EamA domain-containing protein n=1 Tax=Chromera velia CCMP2878 TaxID=1169474 RepID=A0A0G4FL73_9ALVE|eukprot:Cvel_17593.t1-p1 / transcript=Cvel_17593.t1 / gene=Cvel_17593 / organism=Chromera_velia_CCMP2878 / gene_product=hypothetical protein / transcript_product=hypothetical protein / location=Cvel_scaffold1415:222-3243(+) / protein_length=477 / sequence_SO=supercontig / SO=protein_coding / is_pseudo=false